MTTRAMITWPRLPSPVVLFGSHQLKMVRVAARPHPAEMIKMHAARLLAMDPFIGIAMRTHHAVPRVERPYPVSNKAPCHIQHDSVFFTLAKKRSSTVRR